MVLTLLYNTPIKMIIAYKIEFSISLLKARVIPHTNISLTPKLPYMSPIPCSGNLLYIFNTTFCVIIKNTHTTKPKSNEFVIIFYLKIGNLIPTLKILLTPKDMSEPVPISPHIVKCNPVLGLIFNCIYPVKGYGLTPNTIDICSFLP